MYSDSVDDAEFYVFQYGTETFTVQNPVSVNAYWGSELEDGKFYKVVADVTYLNGGVAGYVDYPEIHNVESCDEVSPFDIGLPSIEDGYYGVALVGDYADGDILTLAMGACALWKDGTWLYRYEDMVDIGDGIYACRREGITPEEIRKGMENGVLSCADYFVLPPRPSES